MRFAFTPRLAWLVLFTAATWFATDAAAAEKKKGFRLPSIARPSGFPNLPSLPSLPSVPARRGSVPAPDAERKSASQEAPPTTASAPNTTSPASTPAVETASAAETQAASPQVAPRSDLPATTQLALVAVPAPAERAFAPISQPSITLPDPETVAREDAQRAQELHDDLKTIGPIADLPLRGTVAFAKLRAEALAIVQRRFQESRSKLESDAVSVFTQTVTWTPDFSATPRPVSPADRERARAASADVAHAITHLDRPRFVVAYAAAVFALDLNDALGAENTASAILASGERLYPREQDLKKLKPYRDDAAVVYRYALACSLDDAGKWTMCSLSALLNLGSLYVDLKDASRARPLLLAATAFAPDSWDAALALASCYEMQGRPTLARAALEAKRVAPTAMYGAMRKVVQNLNDTIEAADLGPDSSDEVIEAVMEKLDTQDILTAADFIESIDPAERERARKFVDNLPVQGSFRAPAIDGLTQFSTVRAISQPIGVQTLGDYAERIGGYGLHLLSSMMKRQDDHLARLGISIEYDVDINDVMANPEKYKDRRVNARVSGADKAQLQARADQMRQQAEQARRELDSGNTDTLLQMGASIDPILAVYLLKPLEFANPTDVMIQQYNASMLGRKMHTYNSYFFGVTRRTQESLTKIAELHAKKYREIKEQEAAELALLERQKAAAGPNANMKQFLIMEHNIHMKFAPQYNSVADFAWKQATQVAAKAYEDKIKPRAERFYYDTFRHIALISDPAVRAKKHEEFEQILYFGVYEGLRNVLTAFGGYEHQEDWDCRCDLGGLLEQYDREETELDRIREEREKRARLQFASGEIPPSSPLFQKIDAYGTDIEWGLGFKLKGRISPARSTLSIEAALPTALSPKATYSFTESAFTGATTHGGSLEVSVKATEGPATLSATLNVKGSVAIDGKGVVTDYSVTGASNVKFGMGPATFSAGGEIGYTPAGGLTSDVKAGITSSISDTIGGSAEVGIEVAARRGTTFTATAERQLLPWGSQVNKDIKDVTDPSGISLPIDATAKVPIWSGSFTIPRVN